MKKFKVITVAVVMGLGLVFFVMQCQHKDQDVIPVVGPDPIEHGTEIITCIDCNTTAPAGSWFHDKAHSNVMWETPYKQFGSLLTGRFDFFVLDSMNFDEGVPSKITFRGHVRLNTVNTSEPARDGGCLLTSFGTDAAKVDEPENLAILKAKAGTGRYSTSDSGFLVDAEFTFLGITKDVTVKMIFFPKSDISTAYMAGLYSEFVINSEDFLPNDTNIGDQIKIRVNTLMKNTK